MRDVNYCHRKRRQLQTARSRGLVPNPNDCKAIRDDDPGGFTQRGTIFGAGTPYCHIVKEHDICARFFSFAPTGFYIESEVEIKGLQPCRAAFKFRELKFLCPLNGASPLDRFYGLNGVPDLIIEIFSPATADRDRTYKRTLYARSGVLEYWLVDPDARTIEVLTLGKKSYQRAGNYVQDQTLNSPLLSGLAVPLNEVF